MPISAESVQGVNVAGVLRGKLHLLPRLTLRQSVAQLELNYQWLKGSDRLTVVKGFRSSEIKSWSQQHLVKGSTVISDGLACFNAVTESGCIHDKIVCGGARASVEEPDFYWVNTILGNLKSALRSTYHAVRPDYAQRYLSEFQYLFNRRFDLSALIPRLTYAAVRTPPMSEKLLKLSLA